MVGAWPQVELPPPPGTSPAGDWPVVTLTIFMVFVFASWLIGRERLLPRRAVSLEEELAGQTTALLVLAVLSLLTLATNAFALIFLLPSSTPGCGCRRCVAALPGCAQACSVWASSGRPSCWGSFAWRFELGFDAPWYVLELVAIGYVPLPAIVIALGWFAAAGQLAAIATGRYAPYRTSASARPRADPAARRPPARPGARPEAHGLKRAVVAGVGAGQEARPFRRDEHGTSAPAARAIMCRSCPDGTSSSTEEPVTAERARIGSVRAGFGRTACASRRRVEAGERIGDALQREEAPAARRSRSQRGPNRVPRKAEDERPAADAEPEGFPGFTARPGLRRPGRRRPSGRDVGRPRRRPT